MSPVTRSRSGQKKRRELAGLSVSPRRSGPEVRALLLDAALTEFAAHGFAGATTRRIADAGGVNGALIFRYFGSKAGLYRAAVLEPSQAMIESLRWSAGLGRVASSPSTGLDAQWVEHVLAVVERHPALLVALLDPPLIGDGDGDLKLAVRTTRGQLFDELETGARPALALTQRSVGLPFGVRGTFALVVGLSAYGSAVLQLPTERPASQHDDLLRLGVATLRAAVSSNRTTID